MAGNLFYERPKVATTDEFLKLVEQWAVRYIAVGDVAYTSMGHENPVATMLASFKDNDHVVLDFVMWVKATIER